MKIEIKDFKTDGDNKFVGFNITDDAGHRFVIDKQVPLADKTDEQYVTEALAASQAEIDDWQASFAHVGKEWDAAAGAFKAAAAEPAAEEAPAE
jgi:hypothetical protein